MNNHPITTPASPSLASPLFDASFDSNESLTTTFASPVVTTLETTTVTEVALGYHRNQQYSITAMTTSTGAVAERYAYTAYGQPTIASASGTVLTSSAVGNRYSYTGREWDETLGLHHFRARWMSPLAGRFLSCDPVEFSSEFPSLYSYCENQPLTHVDFMGEVSGRIHHPYPLHLGGCNSQPLIELVSCQAHQAAHDYLKSQGFGFGDEGRRRWAALTSRKQMAYIMRSLRIAGVSEEKIQSLISAIMRGANPGVCTTRSGVRGPIIGAGLSGVLIVLTSPTVCQAGDPQSDPRWQACELACSCQEYSQVKIIPSWWNLQGEPDVFPPTPMGPRQQFGKMPRWECRQLGRIEEVTDSQSFVGYTVITI